MSETIDVAVVGAGLSGLCAARTAVAGGASVVVIEATPRVGGRTLSTAVGRGMFDLGGQWIGPGQTRVAALARELGAATFPTFHQGKKVLDVRGQLSTYAGDIPSMGPLALIDLQKGLWILDAVMRRVPLDAPERAGSARAWDATTLEQYKRKILWHPAVREVFDVAVQVVFGAEPAEISLLHFLFYVRAGGGLMRLVEIEKGAQRDRFVSGAQSLSVKLAAALGERVVKDAPVTALRHEVDAATVTSASGKSWRARRVILAMPPSAIAEIAHEPALPEARVRAARAMPMGATTKILVTYERPFWRDKGLSGEVVASQGGPIAAVFDNTSHDGAQAALVAFVVGERARVLARLGEGERRAQVIGQLSRWFGDEARQVIEMREQVWADEPFTRGCPVGVATVGGVTGGGGGSALREPVGRLHFAGTETATEWNGYLEGAIQAGERAAREALSKL